jgi:O-antigen ligase
MATTAEHSKLFTKIYFWLLVIVQSTLFLPVKINTYAIVILTLFWVGHSFGTPGKLVVNRSLWLFVFFFFTFVIGLFYTTNLTQGASEIEKRSALAILPLIILTCKISLSNDQLQKLILYFFYAGLVVSLGLLMFAFYRYQTGFSAEVFYYRELTNIIRHHPVYYSYYLLFGLLARFLILFRTHHKKLVFWIINVFGVTILVLLASKMVVSLLVIITIFLLFTYFRSTRVYYKLVAGVLLVLLISGSFVFFPQVRGKATDMLHLSMNDLKQEKYAYNYPFNGLNFRLVLWKLSIQHLYNDRLLWFGVGTGDARDYLNEVYAQHGLLDGGYINYNTHNEYVETLVRHGLAGLFFLFSVYLWGFYKGFSKANFFLVIFLLIFAISSWSEASLSVNKGIVFFSLYFPLLLLIGKKQL